MKLKRGLLLFGLVTVLSGCGDTTPPTATVSNYTMERNKELTESSLIDLMVTDVSDNKEITRSNPVDITNYSEIDFFKIGTYELDFVILDDAGNRSNYSATLTLDPTESEREFVEFQNELEVYKEKISDMEDMLLTDEDEIKRLKQSMERLTETDYVNFEEKITAFEQELHAKYVTANDVLLTTNNDLVTRALAIDETDTIILAFEEELDDFDVTNESLIEQNKMYSRGLKIEDALTEKIDTMLIEKSDIPEELFGNSTYKVTTCNYNVGRNPNAKVNVGSGSREYYAYTNENSQLVLITADEIVVQNESTETVNDSGEYCDSPAEVVGDSGYTPARIISDSLGGASNSYNVIPAGNAKSQFEAIQSQILAAGGATNFRAYLTYPSDDSNTPSLIDVSFKIDENLVEYQFSN